MVRWAYSYVRFVDWNLNKFFENCVLLNSSNYMRIMKNSPALLTVLLSIHSQSSDNYLAFSHCAIVAFWHAEYSIIRRRKCKDLLPFPYTPLVAQYILNDVQNNPRTYTYGYSICVHFQCVLEHDGVQECYTTIRPSTFGINFKSTEILVRKKAFH